MELVGYDTSEVIEMSNMFKGCFELKKLDLYIFTFFYSLT